MAAITFTDEDISNITFDFDDNFAEGGLADIYKGFWGGREIAVKEYAQIHKQTWKVEKDFLLRLRHPNIIHLIGWNEQLNVSFLVLEYVESTLELKIPELDWPSTLKVIKQAAGAIGYINGNGIVIGDFKPNNILIDQGKNIKLIDFGSARFGDGYMAKKNDSYAAPEIIKASRASLKSDIYSLGTIILQLITKKTAPGKVPRDESQNLAQLQSLTWKKGGGRGKPTKKIATDEVHVSVKAKGVRDSHIVHKSLLKTSNNQSGCDIQTAEKITNLGIECTKIADRARPSIAKVIAVLDDL